MSTRQLKNDLHARTRERLHRLICDTFDLYEMAELEPRDAAMALADVLMKETVKVLASSEGSDRMIGATIAAMVRFERGEIDQAELGRFLYALGYANQVAAQRG